MKWMRRLCPPSAVAALLLFLVPAWGLVETRAGDRRTDDASFFKASDYLEHVTHLASDELEGRGTGQDGNDKAARYIARQFKRLGVEPAGDDNTFYQYFNVRMGNRIGKSTRLAVATHGKRARRIKLEEDYVPLPFAKSGNFDGDVVFAGYGIVDEENNYDDYDGLDVAGKVVLVLRRTPDFAEFSRTHSSFTTKGRRAAEKKAAAVLVVNKDGDDSGLFNFNSRSFGRARLPMAHISRELADKMLSAAGLSDVAAVQAGIEEAEEPISQPLDGVRVKGRLSIRPIKTKARNVVGLIPGTGPQKDEYIVVGGHYDHLGIRNKGSKNFDPEKHISNGADDNASGTTGVMTIARAFAKGKAPNRSILLILFAAEERGLLGSRHFVKEPAVPLDKCVAMLNMDMIGRLHKDTLQVGGMKTGDGFGDMVERLAAEYGIGITSGGGVSGRSDHASFYRADIPVLFFFTGIHKQYHKPTDDVDLLNIEGAVRVTKLVADCIDEIDARAEPPAFAKDSRSGGLMDQRKDDKKQEPKPAPKSTGTRVRFEQPETTPGVRLGILPAVDDESGVVVAGVTDDTPAARAGLEVGDRIIKIGDTKVASIVGLQKALAGLKNGDSTKLRIRRGTKMITLEVRFGKPAPTPVIALRRAGADRPAIALRPLRPARPQPPAAAAPPRDRVQLGIMITPTDGPHIVVGDVIDGSPAARAGVKPGDAIIRIGRTNIESVENVREALARFKQGDATKLRVRRGDDTITLEIRFGGKAPGRPAQPPRPAARADVGDRVELGISVESSDQPGVLVDEVDEGTPAARAGLKPGDRIVRIASTEIESFDDARKALGKVRPGDAIEIRVRRGDDMKTLRVRFGPPRGGAAARRARPADPKLVDAMAGLIGEIIGVRRALGGGTGKPTLWVRQSGQTTTATIVFGDPAHLSGPSDRGRRVDSVKAAARALARAATTRTGGFGMSFQSDGPVIEIRLRAEGAPPTAARGQFARIAKAPKDQAKQKNTKARAAKQKKQKNKADKKKQERGQVAQAERRAKPDDEDAMPTRPTVRLGIMPSYAESDEPGFEIAGVVDGGPAEKAGMKDDDRILKIGKQEISDIYDYMDALRKYKPGDRIKVIILRKGKKIELTLKAAATERREAA